ncbi:MAG: MATE family efflux transporter [Rhodobiaceae bacterium]|nr:MATE family efflux transporter [Rhodobiaceae bacterium]
MSNPETAAPIGHRKVLAIAAPMTLAYLSTPLLGVVDTTVIGRLGEAHLLGGIGVGAIIFDFVFGSFNFLRSGTTGLTAQALGAGNRMEVAATLLRGIMLSVVTGLVLILLQAPLLEAGLALVGPSDRVEEAVRFYFGIRVLSAPFALANYAILGWFIGLGRAGTGLLLQTLLNGLNLMLNTWFVLGLGWGVAGVAWGTVIGEVVTAVTGIALVVRQIAPSTLPSLATVLDKARFMGLMALNRDILIRTLVLYFAFGFFTAQSARQGDVILAANTVLMNFLMIGGHFLDGFATAAEQLVGEAIGARRRAQVERSVRLTLIWGAGLSAGLFLIFFFGGELAIGVMTTNPEVRAVAHAFLLWAALTPLVGFVAFQFDGVYIGATWSSEMRNMMLLSLVAYLVAWWLLTPLYGNLGLWIALNVFLGARGVTLWLRYPRRLEHTLPSSA